MKKLLLGTSAIAAACAFSTTAMAQLDVTVGGYIIAEYGLIDDDLSNRVGSEMRLEHELLFRADGVSDNGLEYGVKAELQNDFNNAAGFDEASFYIGGSWGRLELGDFDGPADELAFYAPIVGEIEQIDGDYVFFTDTTTGAQPAGFLSGVDSDDSTKIAYMTPEFYGFQAGISYSPQFDEGQGVVATEGGDYDDLIELGLAYTGSYENFNYGLSFTGMDASADASLGLEDFTAWSIGTQLGMGGWTLGAAYVDNDDFGNATGASNDNKAWNVGISYANGPWAVAAQYADGEGNYASDSSTFTGDTATGLTYADDYQVYGLGAVYEVAPGLTVEGDLVFFEADATDGTVGATIDSNDGYVGIIASRIVF